jgi:hypothetical protein
MGGCFLHFGGAFFNKYCTMAVQFVHKMARPACNFCSIIFDTMNALEQLRTMSDIPLTTSTLLTVLQSYRRPYDKISD